jgi:hypothetical protein
MVRTNEQATETALRELIQSSDRLAAPDRLRPSMRQTDAMHEPHVDLAHFAIDEGVLADRIAAIVATTVEESTTAGTVALMLGVSLSSVNRRRSAGRLYAFRLAGIWRFASWQFADAEVIPGVPEIVHSVADQLHPASVRAVMLAPRPTLNAHGRLERPRDFLIRGGDVCRVLEIFVGMR